MQSETPPFVGLTNDSRDTILLKLAANGLNLGSLMRPASYNVENLFVRTKAMNQGAWSAWRAGVHKEATMKNSAVGALFAALLSGCATIPDVTYHYYPTKWSASVSVTQTLGCNADRTELLALHAVAVSPSYSADRTQSPFKIRIKDLETLSADSDMTMTFTDDGRLKSINQSTVGQGESIVKSAVGLAATLAAAGATGAALMKEGGPKVVRSKELPECDFIDAWAGKNKPVSLIYRASIDASKINTTVDIEVAPESKALHKQLESQLAPMSVVVGQVSEAINGPRPPESADHMVWLTLQKVGFVRLSVNSSDSRIANIGGTTLQVPLNDTYRLPIPKAALFGKQSFSLTLADSGSVTSVGYGKNVGVAGALNAFSSIAGQEATSDAAVTAAMKAEADRIVQQQRLMACLKKPSDCK